MARIAVIGLGQMGRPMAGRLRGAGFDVVGVDPDPTARRTAEVAGVALVDTIAEAVDGADVALTMLPDGAVLRAVGAEIVAAGPKGLLWIDSSTVDVASARAAAADAAAAGIDPLDAPVSGGVVGASGGTLTFMVGGPAAAFERAQPFFAPMAGRVVHCGEAGAGQAAKICNNMILGVSMLAVSEAFALADAFGLSRQALYNVSSTASGQCWSLTTYCPAPGVGPETSSDHGYRPGFAATLMLKDLALSQEAGAAAGATTPMGAEAARLYRAFVAQDAENRDFSAVLPWLEAGAPGADR